MPHKGRLIEPGKSSKWRDRSRRISMSGLPTPWALVLDDLEQGPPEVAGSLGSPGDLVAFWESAEEWLGIRWKW
jgi:hypothetical protein